MRRKRNTAEAPVRFGAVRVPAVVARADELRRMGEEAIELVEWDPESAPGAADLAEDAVNVLRNQALGLAWSTMRFVAAQAAALREPSLAPLVVAFIETRTPWEDYGEYENRHFVDALTTLVRAGAEVTPEILALAGLRDSSVRGGVASFLQASDPASRAVLERLAEDPSPSVRTAALASLRALGDRPWWQGGFSSDPLAGLSDAERAAQLPAFERYVRALTERADSAELRAALVELPEPGRLDACERILLLGTLEEDDWAEVAGRLVAEADGAERAVRLLEACGTRLGGLPAEWSNVVSRQSPDQRRAIALRAIRRLEVLPLEAFDEFRGPAAALVRAVAELWPAGEEPLPLLELLLAVEPEEELPTRSHQGIALYELRRRLESGPIGPGMLRVLAEGARNGFSGRLRALKGWHRTWFEKVPPHEVRPIVEDILQTGRGDVAWALGERLGRCFDPATDGDGVAFVEALDRDERLRPFLRSDQVAFAMPLMRKALVRGELDLEQAGELLVQLGLHYGGWLHPLWADADSEPGARERDSRERLARHAAFLGSPEARGPLTDEEWAALRRLRDAAIAARPEHWRDVMMVLTDGPWLPDEVAVREAAMAAVRSGHGSAAFFLLLAFTKKPDPALAAMADEIVRLAPPDDRDSRRRFRDRYRERAGLPAKGAEQGGEEPADEEGDDW